MNKEDVNLKNYRANFYFAMNQVCDYFHKNPEEHGSFQKVHYQCWPIVKDIKDYARKIGIKYIWHFYEPYVELTWLSDNKSQSEKLFTFIEKYLKKLNINDLERKYPDGTWDGDWFCTGQEKMFGNKVHSLCSDFVNLSEDYFAEIKKGRGIEKQVSRTIHRLCNPLGINYKQEAKLCLARGVNCLLLFYFKEKWKIK